MVGKSTAKSKRGAKSHLPLNNRHGLAIRLFILMLCFQYPQLYNKITEQQRTNGRKILCKIKKGKNLIYLDEKDMERLLHFYTMLSVRKSFVKSK